MREHALAGSAHSEHAERERGPLPHTSLVARVCKLDERSGLHAPVRMMTRRRLLRCQTGHRVDGHGPRPWLRGDEMASIEATRLLERTLWWPGAWELSAAACKGRAEGGRGASASGGWSLPDP